VTPRLLVVGAGGWIGQAVAASATLAGWSVVRAGRSGAVEHLASTPDGLAAAVRSVVPTAVVNCVGRSVGSTASMVEANITVVSALLAACGDTGSRLVHLGSAAEYGAFEPGVRLSESARLSPVTDYARSKALATALAVEDATDATVARLFNVAGPQPPSHSFLHELVAKVVEGADPVEMLNPDLRRDWVSIEVVCRAVLRLAEMSRPPRLVNICTGTGISHGELVVALGRAVGRDLTVTSLGIPGVAEVVGDPTVLVDTVGVDPGCPLELLAQSVMAVR
jgi:NDP-hexose 4-ketoreductase